MEGRAMMWKSKASDLALEGKKPAEIRDIINKEMGLELTYHNVRNYLRVNIQPTATIGISNSNLLEALKKECSIEGLCSEFGVAKRVLMAYVDDLRDNGYQITESNDKLKLCNMVLQEDNTHDANWTGVKKIKFGVASDPHLNSKDQQITALNKFYDICAEDEEINTVYVSGDLTEGVNMRMGHEYEIFNHGVDAQARYVIEKYPRREGIVTKFITGNHDHSGIKSAGVDIGYIISRERDDMVYLGKQSARVMLTPNCSLDLVHPLDGASYALSYSTQKYIDSLSGGQKPNILFIGHHHKAMYLPEYRNIHAFEAGTFQAQTAWMRGKRLAAHIGGWIVTVHVDEEGTITRCSGEFIPVYKCVKDDY